MTVSLVCLFMIALYLNMADSFSDTPYNGLTDHLGLLGVQSILIHRSHVIAALYISVSTPDCLAKPKYVTLKVTFGYCLYCGMQKLHYVLPSGYISRYQLLTISNKSAGN